MLCTFIYFLIFYGLKYCKFTSTIYDLIYIINKFTVNVIIRIRRKKSCSLLKFFKPFSQFVLVRQPKVQLSWGAILSRGTVMDIVCR